MMKMKRWMFVAALLLALLPALGGKGEEVSAEELKRAIEFGEERSEKYLFLPEDAMLLTVRNAFEKRRERNSHLAAVFSTRDGTQQSEVLAMLTPWDVIKDG